MRTFTFNDSFFGHQTLPADPDAGNLDDALDLDLFKTGHCHSFALAARDLIGGELVGVQWAKVPGFGNLPNHVLLKRGHQLFDVDGVQDAASVRRFYDVRPLDEEQLAAAAGDSRPFFTMMIEEARPYVEALIERHGRPW